MAVGKGLSEEPTYKRSYKNSKILKAQILFNFPKIVIQNILIPSQFKHYYFKCLQII